jgi:ribose 1,5-bisphosphokinase PhnN
MHIHDTLQSECFDRDNAASNFLAAEIAAFTTLWCYAKITPAALHRGRFANRGNENREAVGRRLEFQSRNFSRLTGGALAGVTYLPCMARC